MKRALMLALRSAAPLSVLLSMPHAHAEEIASVNTNFRFTGSDRISVEA